MCSEFTCDVTDGWIHLVSSWLSHIPWFIYTSSFFVQSSMEGQLADFRILAVVTNATISMEVHLCLFFLCFIDFYWRIVALQCCQFLLYCNVSQLYIPSHVDLHPTLHPTPLGSQRALSCAYCICVHYKLPILDHTLLLM